MTVSAFPSGAHTGVPAVRAATDRVVVPVLVQVVTRAGHQCECTNRGCHGRVERCERTHPQVRLIAAPRDARVAVHAAWRVPVEELAAWCPSCCERAQASARRQRVEDAARRLAAHALPIGLPICADLEVAVDGGAA